MAQGVFYVVATPIGHLGDITHRALATLAAVDLIAAEDTRHSLPLLQHYGIQKPLISLHEHNENHRAESLLVELAAGKSIALITDAGTPAISDPGFRAVKLIREAGFTVVPIPGPSAVITALSASGLPATPFQFLGFLSSKSGERQTQLSTLAFETKTTVLFEAPHRIVDLITDIQAILGDNREITLAKELTKTFEMLLTGKPARILAWLQEDHRHERGEFVVVVAPAAESRQDSNLERILTVLLSECPVKQAVALAAKLTDERPNAIYQLALQIQRRDP